MGHYTGNVISNIRKCNFPLACAVLPGAIALPIALVVDSPVFIAKGLYYGGIGLGYGLYYGGMGIGYGFYYVGSGVGNGVVAIGHGFAAMGEGVAAAFRTDPAKLQARAAPVNGCSEGPSSIFENSGVWQQCKNDILKRQKALAKLDPANKETASWCRGHIPLSSGSDRVQWLNTCNQGAEISVLPEIATSANAPAASDDSAAKSPVTPPTSEALAPNATAAESPTVGVGDAHAAYGSDIEPEKSADTPAPSEGSHAGSTSDISPETSAISPAANPSATPPASGNDSVVPKDSHAEYAADIGPEMPDAAPAKIADRPAQEPRPIALAQVRESGATVGFAQNAAYAGMPAQHAPSKSTTIESEPLARTKIDPSETAIQDTSNRRPSPSTNNTGHTASPTVKMRRISKDTISQELREFQAEQSQILEARSQMIQRLTDSINGITVPSTLHQPYRSIFILGTTHSPEDAKTLVSDKLNNPFLNEPYGNVFAMGKHGVRDFGRSAVDHILADLAHLSPETKTTMEDIYGGDLLDTRVCQVVAHSNGATIAEVLIRTGRLKGVKEFKILAGDRSLMDLESLSRLHDQNGHPIAVTVYAIEGDPVPLINKGWNIIRDAAIWHASEGNAGKPLYSGLATLTLQMLTLSGPPESRLPIAVFRMPPPDASKSPIAQHSYVNYLHALHEYRLVPGLLDPDHSLCKQ